MLDAREMGELEKIFGNCSVAEILDALILLSSDAETHLQRKDEGGLRTRLETETLRRAAEICR